MSLTVIGARSVGAGQSPRRHDGATTRRIVVADDSPPYLEMLVVVLDHMPELTVVGTAGDGLEAVRVAVAQKADAVLLDVDMPGLDGFAAAAEIRRRRPQTELVLHTGAHLDEYSRRGEALNLGVRDKLDLATTLELLARRSPTSLETNAVRHEGHRPGA